MSFDIRSHLEIITLDKENLTEYGCICPSCEGNNLTIAKDSGAYQCWNGCDVADIRNAIAPLNQLKATRPQLDRTWTYTDKDGHPLIQTRRIDDGKGSRKIWQEYFIDGQWVKKGNEAAKRTVMPYNYAVVMEAIAKVDTLGADRAGIHLEFQDYEGHIRRWTMERGLLAGEGVEPLRELMHRGYQFKRPKKAKLLEYLQSLGTDLTDKYLLSDRTGWVKDAFLLENRTYGDEFLRFRSVNHPMSQPLNAEAPLKTGKSM
jgi:Domain of unknown function (DUF927)